MTIITTYSRTGAVFSVGNLQPSMEGIGRNRFPWHNARLLRYKIVQWGRRILAFHRQHTPMASKTDKRFAEVFVAPVMLTNQLTVQKPCLPALNNSAYYTQQKASLDQDNRQRRMAAMPLNRQTLTAALI